MDNFIDFLSKETRLKEDKTQHHYLMSEIGTITELVNKRDGKSPEFEDYKFRNFLRYAEEDIDGLMKLCKEEELPTDMREDWGKGIYEYIRSNFFYNGTVLVFVWLKHHDWRPKESR